MNVNYRGGSRKLMRVRTTAKRTKPKRKTPNFVDVKLTFTNLVTGKKLACRMLCANRKDLAKFLKPGKALNFNLYSIDHTWSK